jgi:hypothetical protein
MRAAGADNAPPICGLENNAVKGALRPPGMHRPNREMAARIVNER